jgi:retron-type reverse transcriptase
MQECIYLPQLMAQGRLITKGVPQGGLISPILSNIMLNEYDQYLDKFYLDKKVKKDRCN